MLASRSYSCRGGLFVKKGFVVSLLALAVIVLVSPGIVGRLAEQSMDKNLDWVATESEEVTVTSQGFDRGWFSSEGQHRVELRDGELRDALLLLSANDGDGNLPALIIDTHIDHGLVPLSSMTRDKGSLTPGLGSAISTLHLEFDDGSEVDLPGTIYSQVGLTGELTSNIIFEPGSFSDGDETAHWGNVNVFVTTSPSANVVTFSGTVDEMAFISSSNEVGINAMEFAGERLQTPFGFAVGDVGFSIGSVTVPSTWGQDTFGPVSISTSSSLDDELVSGRATVQLQDLPFGDLGRATINIDAAAEGVDGQAIGNLSRVFGDLDPFASKDQLMTAAEDDLKRLLAGGFQINIDQLDIALRPGTVSAKLNISVAATDADRFVWTSALMALDATLSLYVPEELMDTIIAMEPQMNAAIGMGFLKKNGNAYEMEAAFQNGLLTVNGAPMPIPIPGL